MPRHYGRRQQQSRQAWLLPLLALSAVAVPVGFTGFHFAAALANAPRYDRDWCRADGAPPAETDILVDRTDPLSERQNLALQAVFDTLSTSRDPALSARGRLTVSVMDGTSMGLTKTVDSFCRPPRTSEESDMGATDSRLAPQYQLYSKRVRSALDKTLAIAPASDWSPIFEATGAIAKRPDFVATPGARRLIIASDLLQNVPGHVVERDAAKLKLQAFLKTPYGQDVRADLKGVEVTVVYLQRRRAVHYQTPAHEEFWRGWFAEMGAAKVEFKQIPE